jgi:FkbM family methyltransferase
MGPEPCIETALSILLRPEMVFYDVGAKHGYYTMLFAPMVKTVVAIEPQRTNFMVLQNKIKDLPNVRLYLLAVGALDGTGIFLTTNNDSEGHLLDDATLDCGAAEQSLVVVRQLDTMTDTIDLIKMDIEGGEIAALLGAQNLLKTSRPIMLIEIHKTAFVVGHILRQHEYEACWFGRNEPIETLPDREAHIVAVPNEKKEMLAQFRDAGFYRCGRCMAE